MAADTAIWDGHNSSVIVGHCNKIVRLPDGGLFAATGRSADCEAVARWLLSPKGLDRNPLSNTDFYGIWVHPGGSVWCVPYDMAAYEFKADFLAIGASQVFMLGALYAGASAHTAVELAIKHTDGAAGDVTWEKLRP